MAQVKDPVCGMTIEDTEAAATKVHNGTTYFFCSQGCAENSKSDQTTSCD